MSQTMQSHEWSERVVAPPPRSELDRRWALIRAAMAREGVDLLVAHSHVDTFGGDVKYLADLSQPAGYSTTLVFPLDDAMTAIHHGPHGEVRDISPVADPFIYGVKKVATTWSFLSASYTAQYDPAAIAKAITDYAPTRIGILGYAQFPHTSMTYLREAFPEVEFIDASFFVDPIRAVKSAEEQSRIRTTLEMQRAAFDAALDAIRPGRREWEVTAAAAAAARERGSIGGVLLVSAGPAGQPSMCTIHRHQNRVLRAQDQMTLLVEVPGIDGYYAEVGRTIVIGSASDELLEEHEFAVGAYRRCVDRLRPGASASEVFDDYNDFMQQHGRPPEQRLHAHSQGYDIVERPLVRVDESLTIEEDMFLAVHPMYVHGPNAILLCDNVLVGSDGASAPLHGIEQKVFEV